MGRPFKLNEKNYYPIFNESENRMIFWWVNYSREIYFDCYFDTEEEAQRAVDKIGEDRIKKYLFRVED